MPERESDAGAADDSPRRPARFPDCHTYLHHHRQRCQEFPGQLASHRLPADGVRAGRRAIGEHPAVRLPASDHFGGGEPSRCRAQFVTRVRRPGRSDGNCSLQSREKTARVADRAAPLGVLSGARHDAARLCRSDQTGAVLLIDAANVVGSRPTGWWRDRAGAARTFVEQVRNAAASGRIAEPVVVVLEGKARAGVPEGLANGVTVEHASGSGDDTLVGVAGRSADEAVTLVTADRALRRRAEELGAHVVGPSWLFERLGL